MKSNIYAIDGKKKGSIELPSIFSEEYRPDLIKRAFLAEKSKKYQPYGSDPLAGKKTSATSWGPGGGRSRIPRVKAGPRRGGRESRGRMFRSKGRWFHAAARGRIMPGTVGGREAHPPKSVKNIVKKLPKKEFKKALRSAIGATTNKSLIKERGHTLGGVKEIPIIIEDKFCSLKKTKETYSTLISLGLENELQRVKGRKIKAGRGKTRGRKYKKKIGPLIVVSNKSKSVAKNLAGVDVTTTNALEIEHFAPGTKAGRFTIWTKSAIIELEERVKNGSL